MSCNDTHAAAAGDAPADAPTDAGERVDDNDDGPEAIIIIRCAPCARKVEYSPIRAQDSRAGGAVDFKTCAILLTGRGRGRSEKSI